jgi:hypothetical protein
MNINIFTLSEMTSAGPMLIKRQKSVWGYELVNPYLCCDKSNQWTVTMHHGKNHRTHDVALKLFNQNHQP